MNFIKTFFRTAVKSSTSPIYYTDVITAPYSFSLKYFLGILFLFSVALVLKLAVLLALFNVPAAVTAIAAIYPDKLIISVSNGRLSINKPLPYYIRMSANEQASFGKSDQERISNWVVFESDQRLRGISMIPAYHTFVLVTETSIYVRDPSKNYKITAYPLNKTQPFTFGPSQIQDIKNAILTHPIIQTKAYVPIIVGIVFLLLFPILCITRFITLTMYAAITFVITRLFSESLFKGKLLPFKKIQQVTLHTITPLIVAEYILGFLPLGSIFGGLLYFLIYLIWTIYVLRIALQVVPDSPIKP